MKSDPRLRLAWATLLALGLLLLMGTASALAQTVTDPNTDPRVREIAKDLQCPVCQNLSVADSPSALAQDMRALIARKLDEGWDRDQIERYFVERYGEGILLTPPRHGFTGLVWLGPWIALGVGLLLVTLTLRGRLRRGTSSPQATCRLGTPTSPRPTRPNGDSSGGREDALTLTLSPAGERGPAAGDRGDPRSAGATHASPAGERGSEAGDRGAPTNDGAAPASVPDRYEQQLDSELARFREGA